MAEKTPSVLATIGTAAGKLDCITPERDLKAAQNLLDAGHRIADLFAKLDEYLQLQQVETDSFILQCRRDDLRAALTTAQGT